MSGLKIKSVAPDAKAMRKFNEQFESCAARASGTFTELVTAFAALPVGGGLEFDVDAASPITPHGLRMTLRRRGLEHDVDFAVRHRDDCDADGNLISKTIYVRRLTGTGYTIRGAEVPGSAAEVAEPAVVAE